MPFTAAALTPATEGDLLDVMSEQIRQLDTRLRFIEVALDPDAEGPSMQDFEAVDRSRERSTVLADKIASLQSSIGSVLESIDTPTLTVIPAQTPKTEPQTPATARSTSTWRSGTSKPAGWQPIARKG